MMDHAARRPQGSRDSLTARRDLDPYQHFEELREQAPVAWNGEMNGWLVTSYEHCAIVERDEETFAAPYAHHAGGAEIRGRHNLLILTGEKHRALHEFFDEVLGSDVVEARRPDLRAIIHSRIDAFAGRGEVELDSEFAQRVPIAAVAELLGLDSDDDEILSRCREWMATLIAWFESSGDDPDLVEAAKGAVRQVEALILPTVRSRKDDRRDDIISALWEFGPTLFSTWDEDDVADQCKTIFQAGSVTTQDLICSLAYRLVTDAGVRNRVETDPLAIPLLVEETLRRENPVQYRMRVAMKDVELGGVSIAEGDRVWAINAAANRDPTRYSCPHDLDLDRKGLYGHLAFNVGPRRCVGRHLARVEAAEAVAALLDRLPGLRLDDRAEPPIFKGLMFRAYRPLHVRFDV